MHAAHARGSRRRLPAPEALERRDVPATFGVPWADPGHLSISFAPDGTAIAGHTSTLAAGLGSQMPTALWQGQILRAFQTWGTAAGINVRLVADDGSPFGTPGRAQHDPRFGDVRIGAQPMSPDALAISVPNDPSMTGTLTGDLLLNAADTFDPQHLDLFAVALHEAGHVLGLDESTDPSSPLFDSYRGNTQLTSADVKAIQALYGARQPDMFEGSSGNDTPSKATALQPPGGYTGSAPLLAFGDIGTARDVDVYALRPPLSGYKGSATIRLQSAGISLLTPRLTVLDDRGVALGEARATSGLGDTVEVRLGKVDPSRTYYLQVQGATADVFGLGHYGLAVSFDGLSSTPAAALDATLRGDYQGLGPGQLDALLRDPSHALLSVDNHADDTAATANVLAPAAGFPRPTHFDALGSISDPTDVDYYNVKAIAPPTGGPAVLTVHTRAVDPNGAAPRVSAFDSDGNPLALTVLANGGGEYTVQAAGIKGGGSVTLRLAGAGSPAQVGNYALEADFGGLAATPTTFAAGLVDPAAAPPTVPLYVARTQLFQFLLTAAGAPGSSLRMTILDASGLPVFDLVAPAGDTVSAPSVMLTPGAYTIRYAAAGGPSTFTLSGDDISDPIGPSISDPTLKPIYTNPTNPGVYTYPSLVTTTTPYWIGAIF